MSLGEKPDAGAMADTTSGAFLAIDRSGRVRDWSPAAEEIFGWRREEMIGRTLAETVLPGQRLELDAVRRDGSRVHLAVEMSAAPTGDTTVFGLSVHDISEHKRAEDALREAEERFRQAFDHAPIGMSLTSLDGVFLRVNHALAEILGRSADELLGMPVADVTYPDDRAADASAAERMLAGEMTNFRAEKRYVNASGGWVWASLSASIVHDAAGRPLYFVSQMEDITRRKEAEAELAYMADHDPLTGLYNRRRFESELDRMLANSKRYNHPVALLVIDLDNFKQINDTLGHAGGDEALTRTADLLRARLRRTDVLARLGGDEFAAVLAETDYETAKVVAADLLSVISTVAIASGRTSLPLSASAGVALFSCRPDVDGDALLQHADTAMYQAKKAGRGTYRLTPIGAGRGDRESEHAELELGDVLRAVQDFGSASAGLVSWEFMNDELEVLPIWRRAMQEGMLRAAGRDAHTGETTYELTSLGRSVLHGSAGDPTPDRTGSLQRDHC